LRDKPEYRPQTATLPRPTSVPTRRSSDLEHTGGVSAAIEYAVRVCNVKHIVVCGHTDCGAMKAALHPESVAAMPAVSHWLKNTEDRKSTRLNSSHVKISYAVFCLKNKK